MIKWDWEEFTQTGNVYYNISDYPKALEYYNKALEIDKELDDKVGIVADYDNIGNVYDKMDNYHKALEYYKKALEIEKNLNDRVGMGRTNYNISFTLIKMNEKKQASDHLFIAKNILQEFEKKQGYVHPLLKDIEDRISFINSNNDNNNSSG